MAETILLETFYKRENRDMYQAYLRIKYQVFVTEFGWLSLADESGKPIAKEDPYDEFGRFQIARTRDGLPVGVVRGIPLKVGFPHRNLFEHHFLRSEFAGMFSKLCTFNSLAVLPHYRRKTYRAVGREWLGSIAKLTMLSLIQSFENDGLHAAIATAGGIAAVRFFCKIGFLVIDPPTETPLHSTLMTNVGIVFGSVEHIKCQNACHAKQISARNMGYDSIKLQHYFRQCQNRSLGSNDLEIFFSR